MLKFLGLDRWLWIQKYIPILIVTIQSLEEAMDANTGEEKKKAVLDYIEELLSKHTPLEDKEIDKSMAFFDTSVDFFVMLFNNYDLWADKLTDSDVTAEVSGNGK